MKTLTRLLITATPAVLLAACTTIEAHRDADVKARFDTYKTYAWAPEPANQKFVSPAVDKAIRSTADASLATKHFAQASGKKTDLYLVYHVTSPEAASSQDYTDWGLGGGYYRAWTGRPLTFREAAQDKPGALILDMIETDRNQLVWRGVAKGVFTGQYQGSAARATQAVNTLLSAFPPQANPAAAH